MRGPMSASLESFRSAPNVIFIDGDNDLEPTSELSGYYRGLGCRHVVVLGRSAETFASFAAGDPPASVVAVGDAASTRAVQRYSAYIGPLNGKWCIDIGPRDFLFFPNAETRKLADLCQFLTDERRTTFFTIRLDVYADPEGERPALGPGSARWFFDTKGYSVTDDQSLNMHLWQGGFVERFPQSLGLSHRRHLSRISLYKASRDVMNAEDGVSLLPRRHNAAVCDWHLSPTGCVISDAAYRRWLSWYDGLNASEKRLARDQLLSAPRQVLDWSTSTLIDLGFMNRGQWF